MKDLKPIKTRADYEGALAEMERLWGAKSGTPAGDRLDILATLVDAYESQHFPMDPPDPIVDSGTWVRMCTSAALLD